MTRTTKETEEGAKRTGRIRARLDAAFAPERLDLRDESEQHRGHAGWREGGGTHFRLEMTASAFAGKSRLERQRLVHAALGPDLMSEIHALSMRLTAPAEK